jgi:ABC-type uncharacterized transport system permease subunit
MWFAVYALTLVAIAQFLEGFMALLQPHYYALQHPSSFVRDHYTAWGWIHLALGVLVLVVIAGVSYALTWARVCAVVIASLSAIAQFGFMSAHPWWATLVIVMNILVIYAVTVHGGEPEPEEAY